MSDADIKDLHTKIDALRDDIHDLSTSVETIHTTCQLRGRTVERNTETLHGKNGHRGLIRDVDRLKSISRVQTFFVSGVVVTIFGVISRLLFTALVN